MEFHNDFRITIQIVGTDQLNEKLIVSPITQSQVSANKIVSVQLIGNFQPIVSARSFSDMYLMKPQQTFAKSQPMLLPKFKFDDRCDSIGITDVGFKNQPDPCYKSVGTCLNMQPRHYFLEDLASDESGSQGSYWLSSFGDYQLIDSDDELQIIHPVNSDMNTLLVFTIAADSIRFVESVAQGKILNVSLPSVIISLDGPTSIGVLVANTGTRLANFHIGIQCDDNITPIVEQMHSIDPTSPKWIWFNAYPSSTTSKNIQCNGMISIFFLNIFKDY